MKIAGLLFASFVFFVGLPALVMAVQEKSQEKPWTWSQEKVKSAVNHVRAGKNLTPESWPDGAKVAVALSFDFDAETNALRDDDLSPGILSQGEYAARVAIPGS